MFKVPCKIDSCLLVFSCWQSIESEDVSMSSTIDVHVKGDAPRESLLQAKPDHETTKSSKVCVWRWAKISILSSWDAILIKWDYLQAFFCC